MYYITILDMFWAILCSSSGGQNCIVTASGIVTLCKRPYSSPVESGLLSNGALYGRVMGKARHHKARLFCRDTRAHSSHDSLLWYSGTTVQLHGKWRSLVSHKQAYVSQQLAYLRSDVILRLSLCAGVRAVIYFSRRPTVRTHNHRRLSAELEDSIVLPLTCLTVCALPLTP
jgi:hypothetical protein